MANQGAFGKWPNSDEYDYDQWKVPLEIDWNKADLPTPQDETIKFYTDQIKKTPINNVPNQIGNNYYITSSNTNWTGSNANWTSGSLVTLPGEPNFTAPAQAKLTTQEHAKLKTAWGILSVLPRTPYYLTIDLYLKSGIKIRSVVGPYGGSRTIEPLVWATLEIMYPILINGNSYKILT